MIEKQKVLEQLKTLRNHLIVEPIYSWPYKQQIDDLYRAIHAFEQRYSFTRQLFELYHAPHPDIVPLIEEEMNRVTSNQRYAEDLPSFLEDYKKYLEVDELQTQSLRKWSREQMDPWTMKCVELEQQLPDEVKVLFEAYEGAAEMFDYDMMLGFLDLVADLIHGVKTDELEEME